MSIFNRIFKITEAKTHSIIDKFEDPIRMTEQGIRDLKKDLQQAMESLAEVKAIAIRSRKSSEDKKKLAADYERKAMLLLQKAQRGGMDMAEAERLATEALSQREQAAAEALRVAEETASQEQMANQLQANVNKIKNSISTYQNDLVTLKARARTAAATKKINKQISKVDTSSTIAMLEKMKTRVEEDESLAQAYGEMASADRSVDDEINAALGGGQITVKPSQPLLEMKKKLGIT
jgi:phage shock protein A